MTEIRIYEEHNKVVVCKEKSAPNDKIHEMIKDYLEWQDESYEYYRLPLKTFMDALALSVTKHLLIEE